MLEQSEEMQKRKEQEHKEALEMLEKRDMRSAKVIADAEGRIISIQREHQQESQKYLAHYEEKIQ